LVYRSPVISNCTIRRLNQRLNPLELLVVMAELAV